MDELTVTLLTIYSTIFAIVDGASQLKVPDDFAALSSYRTYDRAKLRQNDKFLYKYPTVNLQVLNLRPF